MIRAAFYPIWRLWRLFILRAAERQMDKTDPRLPGIVIERSELERAA